MIRIIVVDVDSKLCMKVVDNYFSRFILNILGLINRKMREVNKNPSKYSCRKNSVLDDHTPMVK